MKSSWSELVHIREHSNSGLQKWSLCWVASVMQGEPSVFDGDSWAVLGKGSQRCSAVGFACRSRPLSDCFSWGPAQLVCPSECRRTRFLCSDHTFTLFLPVTPVWTDRRLHNNKKIYWSFAEKELPKLKTKVYVTEKCRSYVQAHICIHPDLTLQVLDAACLSRFRAYVPLCLSDCFVCLFTTIRIRAAFPFVRLRSLPVHKVQPCRELHHKASWVRLHFMDNQTNDWLKGLISNASDLPVDLRLRENWDWMAGAFRFLTE